MSHNQVTYSKQQVSPNACDDSLSSQSDSETIDHSEHRYRNLLNQIKMKSTALKKASNLISILELELEVERNSKAEAVMAAESHLTQLYEAQIQKLYDRLRSLEAQRRTSVQSVHSPGHSPANSSKGRNKSAFGVHKSSSLNRCFRTEKNEKNNLQQVRQIELEMDMYRHWILTKEKWDHSFIRFSESCIETETSFIQDCQATLQSRLFPIQRSLQVDHELEGRVQRADSEICKYRSVIENQQNLIVEMKTYQGKLQEMMNDCLSEFLRSKGSCQPKLHPTWEEDTRDWKQEVLNHCIELIEEDRAAIKARNEKLVSESTELQSRNAKLVSENIELKSIVKQLIELVHNRNK